MLWSDVPECYYRATDTQASSKQAGVSRQHTDILKRNTHWNAWEKKSCINIQLYHSWSVLYVDLSSLYMGNTDNRVILHLVLDLVYSFFLPALYSRPAVASCLSLAQINEQDSSHLDLKFIALKQALNILMWKLPFLLKGCW